MTLKRAYRKELVRYGKWREWLIYSILKLNLPNEFDVRFIGKGSGSAKWIADKGRELHIGDIGVYHKKKLITAREVTGTHKLTIEEVLTYSHAFYVLADKVDYMITLSDLARYIIVHVLDRSLDHSAGISWIDGDTLRMLLTKSSNILIWPYKALENYYAIDVSAWNHNIEDLIWHIIALAWSRK